MTKTKVLIVEDEIIAVTFLKRILREFNYDIAGHCISGEQAVAFLEINTVDIVLMDIVLEGTMDGIDAANVILQRFNTPVLYLTSYSDEQRIDRAVFTEPFSYILKPINERELHANIRMTVYRHDLKNKLHTYIETIENNQVTLLNQTRQLTELNEQLQNSEKQLRELNENKNKLFSIIAHDLRNPFNALLGLSDFLADEVESLDTKQIKRISANLNSSLKNIFNLLDNLLYWARIQTGRVSVHPQPINVRTVLESVTGLLSPAFIAKDLGLSLDITSEAKLWVDTNMFVSALQNLLTNALKFTKRNGNITVRYHIDGANGKISVSDSGVGIPAAKLSSLFDIGEKTSSLGTESETGSGLGLVLIKEFVEKNNGTISLSSIEGEGSIFTLTLPLFKE